MTHTIQSLIVAFFHNYLRDQVGCSPNTIQSYCECIRLLIQYSCQEQQITADQFDMETVNDRIVLAFLDSLQEDRGNMPRTRNQRLAAIKSFYRYLALQEPTLMNACKRICAICPKKTEHKVIEPLTEEEVKSILEAVPSVSLWHLRDYALILLMYNTGARVQELVDLKIADMRADKVPQVKLKGKGGKERIIPLWSETADAVQRWLEARERAQIKAPYLFVNSHLQQITRFGISHILAKHTANATETCPSLLEKNVTPHTLRHTAALHLIQSDVDISVAKDWLGHADTRTTSLYVDINMEMRRKALEQCPPPGVDRDEPMVWHQPQILALLHSIAARNYVK